MQTITLPPPDLRLKPLEELAAEIVCGEMGPPVFNCYCSLDWKVYGTTDDVLDARLCVPEFLSGDVFYDGSKFSLTVDIGHMRPGPQEVRRAFDAMMEQLRGACRLVRERREKIRVRAGTVFAIHEIARKHKNGAKVANPFLSVAGSCLARKTNNRVTPLSARTEPLDAEDLVSMGMKISLANRDLLLRRHDAEIGANFSEEQVVMPNHVPETLRQSALGGPLGRLIEMPRLDMIETEILEITPQGQKTRVNFRSPRLDLRGALELARSLQEAANAAEAKVSG